MMIGVKTRMAQDTHIQRGNGGHNGMSCMCEQEVGGGPPAKRAYSLQHLSLPVTLESHALLTYIQSLQALDNTLIDRRHRHRGRAGVRN
jgi:hypothetical protein